MSVFGTGFNYKIPGSSINSGCACARENCFGCETYEKFKEFVIPPSTNHAALVRKPVEELAEWICQTKFREGDFCPPKHGWQYCQMADGCRKCWLSWLKSPVEVDDGT